MKRWKGNRAKDSGDSGFPVEAKVCYTSLYFYEESNIAKRKNKTAINCANLMVYVISKPT